MGASIHRVYTVLLVQIPQVEPEGDGHQGAVFLDLDGDGFGLLKVRGNVFLITSRDIVIKVFVDGWGIEVKLEEQKRKAELGVVIQGEVNLCGNLLESTNAFIINIGNRLNIAKL